MNDAMNGLHGLHFKPHYVAEPASWDASKKQYRVVEYGQTVAVVSSKKRAEQAVRTAKYYSTSAVFRRAKGRR